MTPKEKLMQDIDRAKANTESADSRLRTAQTEFDRAQSYWYGLRDALRAIENAEKESAATRADEGLKNG